LQVYLSKRPLILRLERFDKVHKSKNIENKQDWHRYSADDEDLQDQQFCLSEAKDTERSIRKSFYSQVAETR
jgi:hypothetical protein